MAARIVVALCAALGDVRREGKPFALLVFPDEVHDFLRHGSWRAAYRAAAEYFDRTIGRTEAAASQ